MAVHPATQLMRAIVKEGSTSSSALAGASLASTQPSHAERDLHRWLRDLYGFGVDPMEIPVNLVTNESLEAEDGEVPSIYSHRAASAHRRYTSPFNHIVNSIQVARGRPQVFEIDLGRPRANTL